MPSPPNIPTIPLINTVSDNMNIPSVPDQRDQFIFGSHATFSGWAVGGLHQVFHLEVLVKNLVSLIYNSNILKYSFVWVPGKCIPYDRDTITPIRVTVIDDDTLLSKLKLSVVMNVKLTMSDGSIMQATPESTRFSNESLWLDKNNHDITYLHDNDTLHDYTTTSRK